jgi:hypothetical protein
MRRSKIASKSAAAAAPGSKPVKLLLALLFALPAYAQHAVTDTAVPDRSAAPAATTTSAPVQPSIQPAIQPTIKPAVQPQSAAPAQATAAQAPANPAATAPTSVPAAAEPSATEPTASQPAAPETAARTVIEEPSTAPPGQKTPYAYVCLPYEDKPAPPRRKPAHKEQHQTAPAAPVVAEAPPEPRSANSPVISILGKKVYGRDGENLGRVVDVLADGDGARAAVIDFGGFLGVGNRRVAVDWHSLQIDPTHPDKPVILQISRNQVSTAPEFKETDHPEKAIVTEHSSAAAPPRP